jgi:hypothetical protein
MMAPDGNASSFVLTRRAYAWLATLRRERAMPTARVERLILDIGGTPHALWLDFHDRYGGYVEEVGPGEVAVWGLARAKDAAPPNVFSQPDHVFIRGGDGECTEAIACAEANPVHQYELYADGWFNGPGGSCPSFDMNVERHGLMHELFARGKIRERVLRDPNATESQQLLHEVAQWLVSEASTKDTQFFFTPDRLVRFDPAIKQILVFEVIAPRRC